jgi:hypothetical protein
MTPKPDDDKKPLISRPDHNLLVLWLAQREAKVLLNGLTPASN